MRSNLVVPTDKRIEMSSSFLSREMRMSFEKFSLDRLDDSLSFPVGLWCIWLGELLNDGVLFAECSKSTLELLAVV